MVRTRSRSSFVTGVDPGAGDAEDEGVGVGLGVGSVGLVWLAYAVTGAPRTVIAQTTATAAMVRFRLPTAIPLAPHPSGNRND